MKKDDLDGSTDFVKFLLAEYNNIAEAHFRTNEAISRFFQYYLTIMAIPITVYTVAVGLISNGGTSSIIGLLKNSQFLLAPLALAVSLAGLGVVIYIINLRMDSILYARTINSIRKYFYDRSNVDAETELRMRVLPQSPSLPHFMDLSYFLPVVLTFAVFNTLYLETGLILSVLPIARISLSSIPWWIWASIPIFVLGHISAYAGLATFRERSYLRSFIIGVDIDGVMNDHRKKFCELLFKLTKIELDPEQITTIPIHEDPSLGVTERDERVVFNNPSYWTKMPALDRAAYNIGKLRDRLRLDVHIFTYRPWPTAGFRKKRGYDQWKKLAIMMIRKQRLVASTYPKKEYRIGLWIRNRFDWVRFKLPIEKLQPNPLNVITLNWLVKNGFRFDKLTVERGYDNLYDSQFQFKNRFWMSKKRQVRFFVEDDIEKARKLAFICEVVFLLDQPYNRKGKLPSNVVRVYNWDEIYKKIRMLS